MSVNLMFLVVGHTHEDIDQLFGVVVALILQLGAFETIVEIDGVLVREVARQICCESRASGVHVPDCKSRLFKME